MVDSFAGLRVFGYKKYESIKLDNEELIRLLVSSIKTAKK
ncbi:hypothetical protein MNB_SV-4-161 [hydrothermal vent metagenome]|uniref:Uncharacterized protein n=1 Tax=hydrothermal vent metagenome TaxID=652676 RepID=A0A1W1EB31_9ZZZZ